MRNLTSQFGTSVRAQNALRYVATHWIHLGCITMVKTNHTMRMALETAGVAMLSGASYVDSHFDESEVAIVKALDRSTIKWQAGQRAIIARGKWGNLVRFGTVSEDGNLVGFRGADGAEKIVTVKTLSLGYLVLTLAELVQTVTAAGVEGIRVLRQLHGGGADGFEAGEEILGLIYGSHGASYSSLIYTFGGKLRSKDVEIRANNYNKLALVSLADVSKATAKLGELTARLEKAAGIGAEMAEEKKAVKAVKKAKKANTEAIDASAIVAEVSVENND